MATGETFRFKDVIFDCKLDLVSKKIVFVLSKIDSYKYASVDIRLHIPKRSVEDCVSANIDSLRICYSRNPTGICFLVNGNIVRSPHSIDKIVTYLSLSLANCFKDISNYESFREFSLSSSLVEKRFTDRMTKWFHIWCSKKIKEKIYNFVVKSCNSLLGYCNLDDLERQRFFTSAFSASNWDNLMSSETMELVHHVNMPCSDDFKKNFALPVSRKCLLDACYIDGRLIFRKKIISKSENFHIALGEKDDRHMLADCYQYYDNWKSYMVMSDNEKDLGFIERCMPFMRENFSYCYINHFQYVHPMSKIDSQADFRTALSISSAIGDFYLRSPSCIDIVELREKFRHIYEQYLLDKSGMVCKIHDTYLARNVFSGTVQDMKKSLPVYSAAWSNYLEEEIFLKDKPKKNSINILDEEMEIF